jgi:hypothetical protein
MEKILAIGLLCFCASLSMSQTVDSLPVPGKNIPGADDSRTVAAMYYELSSQPTVSFTQVPYGILNIQFVNNYASVQNIELHIYDVASKSLVKSEAKPSAINSITGLNRICIDLRNYRLQPEKLYILALSDFSNNYYFNFKVTKP